MTSDDPFDLARFVVAQDSDAHYARAITELERGRKSSHWMWFVFPQIAGLGPSAMSRKFAISGLDEATAYWNHPVLGPRLGRCLRLLEAVRERSAEEILGPVDAQKLHSSLTLFERSAGTEPVFGRLLDRYFDGERDPSTLARLPA